MASLCVRYESHVLWLIVTAMEWLDFVDSDFKLCRVSSLLVTVASYHAENEKTTKRKKSSGENGVREEERGGGGGGRKRRGWNPFLLEKLSDALSLSLSLSDRLFGL